MLFWLMALLLHLGLVGALFVVNCLSAECALVIFAVALLLMLWMLEVPFDCYWWQLVVLLEMGVVCCCGADRGFWIILMVTG